MLYALSGFALRGDADGRLLSGNALRYHHERGEIFAKGNVLMLIPLSPVSTASNPGPMIRLQAAELGMQRLEADDEDFAAKGVLTIEARQTRSPFGCHFKAASSVCTPNRLNSSPIASPYTGFVLMVAMAAS